MLSECTFGTAFKVASANLTDSVIKSLTSCSSSKRISFFVGCILTSSLLGGIAKNMKAIGNLPSNSFSLYPASSASWIILLDITLPLTQKISLFLEGIVAEGALMNPFRWKPSRDASSGIKSLAISLPYMLTILLKILFLPCVENTRFLPLIILNLMSLYAKAILDIISVILRASALSEFMNLRLAGTL